MTRKVTIAVITRGGSERLRPLLAGFAGQEPVQGWALDVVVVDNSAGGIDVARRADLERAIGRLPLRIVAQPLRGIPVARNAAIAACLEQSDVLIWQDDDEVPADAGWVRKHLEMLDREGVEVSSGPVQMTLPVGASSWVRDSVEFDRPVRVSGSAMQVAVSSNCATSMAIYREVTPWFDEGWIGVGGTDSEFFTRVARAGHTMVWHDEAVVTMAVPASRATMDWVLRRRFRTGGTKGRVQRQLDGLFSLANVRRFAVGGLWLLGGLALFVVAVVPGALGWRRARRSAMTGLGRAAFGLGTAIASTTGWVRREYHRVET